ncbi:MAG: sigma-70 family RNA polymerase sigma factor [Candidatus Asgardarchaeia archaeon]
MSRTRLTKKQQKLVTNNIRLLTGFISDLRKKEFIFPHLKDDLISDLCLNFCISASKYDEDYGTKFSTYAYWGFNKSIAQIYGKEKEKFDRYNFCSSSHIRYLEESVVQDAKKTEVKKDFLYELLDGINAKERDKKILIEYYSHKISQEKLGKKYDLSGRRIQQIIMEMLNKLRRIIRSRSLLKNDFYIRD